jgi:hypothetical protein
MDEFVDNLEFFWKVNDELHHNTWQNCPLLAWTYVQTKICDIEQREHVWGVRYRDPDPAPDGVYLNRSFFLSTTADRVELRRQLLTVPRPIECVSDPELIWKWPFVVQLQDLEPMLSTEKLRTLPGGKLAKERNGVKRWKDKKWIMSIDDYDPNKALKMYERWVDDMQGRVEANAIVFQSYIIRELKAISKWYPINITCLQDGDDYLAVGVGARVSNSTWTSLIRVSRRGKDFQYASDAAFVKLAELHNEPLEADGWMGFYDPDVFGGLIRFKRKFLSIGEGKGLFALTSVMPKEDEESEDYRLINYSCNPKLRGHQIAGPAWSMAISDGKEKE